MRSLISCLLRIERTLCRSTASKVTVFLALFSAACALNQMSLNAKLPRLDEILYLHQGKMFINEGMLPPLCANPLPTFVNGLLYVSLHQQPNVLARVSSLRRYFALAMILGGTWYAGSCIADFRGAFMATLLVSTLPFSRLTLINSTDALYCASIMVALGPMIVVLSGNNTGNRRLFLVLGACLAAAFLSRSDGLIVAAAWFLAMAVLIWRRSLCMSWRFQELFASLAIFALPIVGYCCLVGIATGDFRTGLSERTYSAFLQGENVLFTGRFLDTAATKLAGGEDYGTYEQNGRSVITAIVHHRTAFANRLRRIPANFFVACVSAWGGYLLGLFACLILGVGVVASLRSSRSYILLIAVVILSPLMLYPLTFYRPGYIAMNIPALCVLAIGAAYSWRPPLRQVFNVCFTVFMLLGALTSVVQTLRSNHLQNTNLSLNDADQAFVQQLAGVLPKDEKVISVDPSLLWNAGLEHDAETSYSDKMFSISRAFLQIHSVSDLVSYMHDKHLRYIMIDPVMNEYYPEFARVVVQAVPPLQVVLRDPSVDRQVYLLTDQMAQ